MAVDNPLAALLCSIFIGPLGIQGWIVSPNNPNYGPTAQHQRNTSIAIYILITLLIIFTVIHVSNTTESERQLQKNGLIPKTVFQQILEWTGVAFGITVFLSFVLAVRIVLLNK